MKIFTEFVILHSSTPHPGGEFFCPFIWQSENFDSDGDYYFEHLGGKWFDLHLLKKGPDSFGTNLQVLTFWEDQATAGGGAEVDDLRRFIEYRNAGRYSHLQETFPKEPHAVTSLAFTTSNTAYYLLFLQNVLDFLSLTRGILVNCGDLTSAEFKDKFLTN